MLKAAQAKYADALAAAERAAKEGRPLTEVADQFSINANTLAENFRQAFGMTFSAYGGKSNAIRQKHDLIKLRAIYERGIAERKTLREMAAEAGIHSEQFRRVIIRHWNADLGLTGRHPGKQTKHTTPEEHALRRKIWLDGKAAGLSLAEIAEDMDLTHGACWQWASRYLSEEERAIVAAPHRKKQRRVCLGTDCGEEFDSEGPWNRLCNYCRARSHDDSPYAPNPGGKVGRRVPNAKRA